MSPIKDNLQSLYPQGLNENDRIYIRIARNEPAYISLLFPLIIILILNLKFQIINKENALIYIFNTLACLGIFLPALFFFYKQIIRSFSVLIVEKFLFNIFNPYQSLFINNSPWHISELEWKTLKEALKNGKELYESRHDYIWIWCKKKFAEEIKLTMNIIRTNSSNKDNSIVFDNNCTYGFFRNLTGGLLINIILIYATKFFLLDEIIKELPDFYSTLETIFSVSLPILVILIIICILLSFQSRYRHGHKMIDNFIGDFMNNHKLHES